MLIIQMNCRNQRLSRYTGGTVAEGSYGYLKLQFNFKTDDWNDVSTKIANFYYKGKNYPRLIDENNLVTVPEEVIHHGVFSVDVFGGGITTNKVDIPVEHNNSSHGEDDTISAKYYNEIINKLTAQIDDLNETKADSIIHNEEDGTIQLSANGNPIGEKVGMSACGIAKFDVDDNDNVTITMNDGRVIELGRVSGASGVTFIPHISDDMILSWTNDGGLENPAPVDLNRYDEWIDDDGELESDYIWTDE